MEIQRLWQRPTLRIDEEEGLERKTTWLELFFDLVFVVVIAELAHTLSENVSVTSIGVFGFLFIPVWWVWIGVTSYVERFETSDISFRLFLFLQMIPVAAMAVFAHDALGETSQGFALAYISARALLTVLSLRGGWHEKSFRTVSNRSAIGASISIGLFLASVFVAPPLRFVLWGIGLLIELIVPWLMLKHVAQLPRRSSSKLTERFGLLTIIVLGESIVGVISGVARNHEATAVGVAAVLGLALAFGIWWVYFDFVARRPPRSDDWVTVLWGYLHLPLVLAIAANGAALLAVVGSQGEALQAEVRWLITGAVAIALITIGLLELVLQREPDEPTHPKLSPALKIVGGVLAVIVGALGGPLVQIPLLSVLIMLVLAQIVYGTYVWIRPNP